MSIFQESAQYLAGLEVPNQVLTSLLTKVSLPDRAAIGLVNLSPYDSWLEWAAYQWPLNNTGVIMPALSLSKSLQITEYCQRSIALKLMEDCWYIILPASSLCSTFSKRSTMTVNS